jgi:hypothetical protein
MLLLIFFQMLWLRDAKGIKEKQINDNIFIATTSAGKKLMEDKTGFLSMNKKSDLLFPNDKLKLEILRPSVLQRFTKEEIWLIIRNALDNNFLKGIPFEFAVTDNSLTGEQVETEQFFKYFIDSAGTVRVIHPLEPPPGSNLENLVYYSNILFLPFINNNTRQILQNYNHCINFQSLDIILILYKM